MTFFDDEPSADPEIQAAYARGLGEMLVAFNAVEHEMSDIILRLCSGGIAVHVAKHLAQETYSKKIETLKRLRKADPKLFDGSGLDDLVELARDRNHFAHAHFYQNPFDGSYEAISSKVTTQGFEAGEQNPADDANLIALEGLTKQAWAVHGNLRLVGARLDFSDLEIEA